jgi:ribosomal protein S27AE
MVQTSRDIKYRFRRYVSPAGITHCSTCQTSFEISGGLAGDTPTCDSCHIPVCLLCSSGWEISGKDENGRFITTQRMCGRCLALATTPPQWFQDSLLRRIDSYRRFDCANFGGFGDLSVERIKELIVESNSCCQHCGDPLLIANWPDRPFCCYQLSVDRICNGIRHRNDNVGLSCSYCNRREYHGTPECDKICQRRCHSAKRAIEKKIIDSSA